MSSSVAGCLGVQACADKLEREITMFGLPPQFPTEQEQAEEEAAKTEAANKQAQESTADPTKFKTKKVIDTALPVGMGVTCAEHRMDPSFRIRTMASVRGLS